MKNLIYPILSLLLICFSAKAEASSEFSVFDAMQPGYQLMKFISAAKPSIINTNDWQTLDNELLLIGLKNLKTDQITIANNSIQSKAYSKYYSASTNKEFVLIESFDNEADLLERWKDIGNAIELYSGKQNGSMGKYYLKLDESNPVSLNTSFRSDSYIFNIKQQLSFTNTDTKSWSPTQVSEYQDHIDKLNQKLELLIKYVVDDSEHIYKPLNGQQLTSEERLFGFINFWTEVKYNFAFFDQVPDLDWDVVLLEYIPKMHADQDNAAYYKRLSKVCALLNDGHTNIYFPAELSQNTARAPIQLRGFDNDIVLTNLDSTLESRLDIGLKLISLDNVPIEEYIQQQIIPFVSASTDYIKRNWAISKLVEGELGSSIDLSFTNNADSIINIQLERRKGNVNWIRKRPDWHRVNFKTQDDIGKLEINTFNNQQTVDEFEPLLDTLQSLDKLIIDLRKNGGGNSGIGYQILDYFSTKSIITSKWKTREHKPSFKAWGD